MRRSRAKTAFSTSATSSTVVSIKSVSRGSSRSSTRAMLSNAAGWTTGSLRPALTEAARSPAGSARSGTQHARPPQNAAGKDPPLPLAAEADRRRHDLEAHVARAEQPRAGVLVLGQLRHRLLDALVAAPQALAVAEAGGADLVRRRDDDALAVIEHEPLGIGKRELDAPPAAHGLAHLADDVQLLEPSGVDGHSRFPRPRAWRQRQSADLCAELIVDWRRALLRSL